MFVIKVNGMSCGHCVSAITKALAELDKTAKIQIDKASQTVRFDGDADQDEHGRPRFVFPGESRGPARPKRPARKTRSQRPK